MKAFAQFYQQLFTSEDNDGDKLRARDTIRRIIPKKICKDSDMLDRELSLEEVNRAILVLNNDKDDDRSLMKN